MQIKAPFSSYCHANHEIIFEQFAKARESCLPIAS